MSKVSLYISKYDLDTAHRLLLELATKHKNMELKYLDKSLVSNGTSLPTRFCYKLTTNDGNEISIVLNETRESHKEIFERKCVMSFSSEAIDDMKALEDLADELNRKLCSKMPDLFHSMEHFCGFLKSTMTTNIYKLTDTLLLSSLDAVDKVLVGFTKREILHYDDIKNNDAVCHRRVEVKNDEFRYIPINEYQIYQKGDILFAVGISEKVTAFSVENHIFLTGIFGVKDAEVF